MVLAEAYGLRGYDAVQLGAVRVVNALCIANSLPLVISILKKNATDANFETHTKSGFLNFELV